MNKDSLMIEHMYNLHKQRLQEEIKELKDKIFITELDYNTSIGSHKANAKDDLTKLYAKLETIQKQYDAFVKI